MRCLPDPSPALAAQCVSVMWGVSAVVHTSASRGQRGHITVDRQASSQSVVQHRAVGRLQLPCQTQQVDCCTQRDGEREREREEERRGWEGRGGERRGEEGM